MCPERPDLAFTVKELAKRLSEPSQLDWAKLKRAVRYTRSVVDYLLSLNIDHTLPHELHIYTDAAWANSSDYRGSSGGVAMCRGFLITSWARTQKVTTQSSAEAELLAVNLACAEGAFLRHVFAEVGAPVKLTVLTDAMATLAFTQKTGVGRMRHLAIREMFVQEQVQKGLVTVRRVSGDENPADMLTKHMPNLSKFKNFVERVGLHPDLDTPHQAVLATIDQAQPLGRGTRRWLASPDWIPSMRFRTNDSRDSRKQKEASAAQQQQQHQQIQSANQPAEPPAHPQQPTTLD